MSRITPASHIATISGKLARTDRTYTRVNKHTGQVYGIGIHNPNRVEHPTEAQQRSQSLFRDTWHQVDTLLSDPSQRAEYERLFRQHLSQSRKRRKKPCASLRTFVFHLLYPKKD